MKRGGMLKGQKAGRVYVRKFRMGRKARRGRRY